MAKAIELPTNTDIKGLKSKLKHEKQVAFKYQKRRHNAWTENYELYRNIIRTNRLTQRQAINIPLMKETVKTIGSKINEEPYVRLDDLSGDADKEIVVNSLWESTAEENQLDIQDRVDKKQEQLYGRSHTVINPVNGRVLIETKDPYEVLVDPKTKPYDIETARFIIITDIYKPLDEVLRNDRYDKEAKGELKLSYDGKKGGKIHDKNSEQAKARRERQESLGIHNPEDIEGYDKLVKLDIQLTHVWDRTIKEYVRYYCLVANDDVILEAHPLIKVIGIDSYPIEGWADDIELTDYWSDSTADLIRVPNKTINAWISQYMENRTLRTFGMNFYNSKIKGFKPKSFKPRPFGWYPLAGKPSEVYQHVEVPELSGTLEDIQFIVNIAEKASATGAVEKGAVEDVKRTLGEIEIAVGNAIKRTNDMALYYNTKYERIVRKWYDMMLAVTADGTTVPLYKKNIHGALVRKDVSREDFASADGYKITVGNKTQRVLEQTDEITRMLAVKAQLPDNPAFDKAIKKRMVGMLDLTPEEIAEIEDYEAQKIQAMATGNTVNGRPVPVEAEVANETLKALTGAGA